MRPSGARRRGEAGYAAILVAALAASVLMPVSALAVDVARWYVEAERVQKAADAAAMAGVTYLPDNFAEATATAKDVAARNGYSTGVTVRVGPKPTQLVVTVRGAVANAFSASFSQRFTTITRSATADYNGPAPMGSPCNTFGNEPPGSSAAGPVASQLSIPPGGAQCSSSPMFWANAHGPNVYKVDGDQLLTRSCSGGEDGCSGSTNADFRPQGYFYVIRVTPAAVGRSVTMQLYDPAYVPTGQQCESRPGAIPGNNMNPYASADAVARYRTATNPPRANEFCNGDSRYTGSAGNTERPTVTSFGMRGPVDTYVPTEAPPMPDCVKQYPGYTTATTTAAALRSSSPSYSQKLAAVLHQWATLCTFTPTRAGDYYLQVRTNVALNTANYDGRGGYDGNMSVFTQSGDDTSVLGNGGNTFAIRAISSASGALSVAGWDRMSIWMNSEASSSTFNLVRVIPAAASKSLTFEFFDAGDAASGGTIKVLPPAESTLPMSGCVGSGRVNGPLPGCQVSGVSSTNGWNGKSQVIRVPIPNTYTCNATNAGGCWFRVQVSFGGATVHDVTTWTARIEGDPVRLIE